MDESSEQFIGYLKFSGPSVEEGKIDIEKIGNSLVSLNNLFKNYCKGKGINNAYLKLGRIQKKCTEVNIFLDQLVPLAQPIATTVPWVIIANSIGLPELGKQFFGTVGQQIALKLFSKGEKIRKKKDIFKGKDVFALLENAKGEEKEFLKEIYDSQKEFSEPLNNLIQLEEKKEEKVEIGYYQNSSIQKITEVDYLQKVYFETTKEPDFEDKLEEEFDESNAKEIKIIGKFIDYHGLANKYRFSFQARKNQEKIGKQKILCKVNDEDIPKIIDLLKPTANGKNICICGKATKDNDNKIDKIRIDWFNEDENYNPNQNILI